MPLGILISLLLLFFPGLVWGQANSQITNALEQPGVLIITSARDTTAGFQWQPGPGNGRISLVWPGGVLSLPDSLAMEAYPNSNLAIPLIAGFSGNLEAGPFALDDGTYEINENLIMSDGVIQLIVSSGELEIFGPRFRYTLSSDNSHESRSNYLLIAGLLVLIAVLLRRSRMILRKRA